MLDAYHLVLISVTASVFNSIGIVALTASLIQLQRAVRNTNGHELSQQIRALQIEAQSWRGQSASLERLEMDVRHFYEMMRHDREEYSERFRDLRNSCENLIDITSALRDRIGMVPGAKGPYLPERVADLEQAVANMPCIADDQTPPPDCPPPTKPQK